ncbi:FMN-binding glutamate synthase family protein [Candidatus Rariloculus sp.]|uniref:FMN-binding glutamate synthase family protein n=1 Tax=Candidatus Rariloculus sp. TaxID=3101265 RepID=UPI003D0DD4CD
MAVLTFLVYAFIFMIGLGVLVVAIVFVMDVTQTQHAIRHNFPVIGRCRALFERLGEFFRQYFFALDRDELPFNRAERSWVYRASKAGGNTIAFGSTRDLRRLGTVIYANSAWPLLEQDVGEPEPVTIGLEIARPYTTKSIINISAMSYGAISRPAVLALSRGAKRAGIWLNTGEGGLSPYHLEGGCDLVFQIGTANYGVRDAAGRLSDAKLAEVAAHEQVRMFELKLSQGAKPGKGGILPAVKVTKQIASIRGIPVHQASISPNRRPDVDSVGGLLDVIERIRGATGKPVGFKTVVGDFGWIDELFEEIHRRGTRSAPDFITVDGGDGGSGAAPMPLMDSVGMVVRESLPLLVDRLVASGLRERIKVITSGKLIIPSEAAWAFCAGADFVASARGFMFALGCIQAMQCNRNTCPTGITTHKLRLQRGLDPADKAVRVARYAQSIAAEIGMIAHSCGVSEPRQLERRHCRIVTETGRSVPLDEIYPPVRLTG